ncbi:MAG: DUF951 domain-containing protein [Dehalococcoidia bacterium]|nr:DUF951 domain-containing protein [Dehalococcoidia bacterium]
MDVKLGDVVRLRKQHPCGGAEWQVVRLGGHIGIRCLTCQREVFLERGIFERRVRALVSRDELANASDDSLAGDALRRQLKGFRKRALG